MLLDGKSNRLRRNGFAAADGQTQRVLHRILTFPGRQLQNLQVLADALTWAMIATQPIVGHAKVTAGKHVLPILVILKRTGFADQRIDHVTVIDRVFPVAGQTRHPLDFDVRIPDLDEVGVDHHVHLLPNQPAGNRIRVAFHLDRAAAADLDAGDALPVIQLARRQLAKTRFLLGKLGLSRRVALVAHFLQEPFVLLATGKVAAASQQQSLLHGGLEMAMRRFNVTVLVRLADVDALRLDLIVAHQVAVTCPELTILRKVVDRRTEAVAAVPTGHAPQPPKRFLQPAAQRLERLGKADCYRLPIRVRQREVVYHVVKRLGGDRHTQRIHAREIRRPQAARIMDLRKHHLLTAAMPGPPVTNPTLERPPLRVRKPAGITILQPIEERECPQPRFGLKTLLHFRPYFGERIHPCPPCSPQLPHRGQPSQIPILPGRLLIHARFPRRCRHALATREQPTQLSHLTIRDHRNLLWFKGLRILAISRNPGILIVAQSQPTVTRIRDF
jgi:hypothetical protein